jgi:hypothetical protein
MIACNDLRRRINPGADGDADEYRDPVKDPKRLAQRRLFWRRGLMRWQSLPFSEKVMLSRLLDSGERCEKSMTKFCLKRKRKFDRTPSVIGGVFVIPEESC